ncbi:MAG: amidohydrolase family protein, partial [Cyanothece sp. SIO2G6]|nr:amidohydrolase family protein [Cyanothece sp. SIO2G6]
GNMLDVAMMAVHVCQMTGRVEIDACYNMVTWHGAKTLHLSDRYGIEVGKPANLVVLAGSDRYDVLCRRATVSHVISQGKLIAQTQPAVAAWLGGSHESR